VARFGMMVWLTVALGLLGACAATPERRDRLSAGAPLITPFSLQEPGAALPGAWRPWTFSAHKRPTQYDLVDYAGRTVIAAQAETAASGLIHPVRFDPSKYPYLTWRWKATALIAGANNSRGSTEDSPVRIMVAFDGDMSKLKPMDQLVFRKFRMLTKSDLPFATLMYIWENRTPAGSIIANPHTARIKMIVTESGNDKVGQWHEQTVNLVEDFRRAFGEEPPPVIWVGVMTDTDNTGEKTRAYYGDIQVGAARP
jgi:Protein of unknown function (DUF3047)